MSRNNLIAVVVVVLLVVGFGLWQKRASFPQTYSVVYLTTGEIYVGKLSTFPSFKLKDAYILQIAKDATDATKTAPLLNPINEALWAPQILYLNKKNVVFYGPLLPSSKIAQKLAQETK